MIYHFSKEDVQRAQDVCLVCPNLGDRKGYCLKARTDSLVFKAEKCDKIKEVISKP